jgi:hypothetical protein
MKESRARQILQALVQGVDPLTGEELAAGTVLQHAEVLRALLAGVGALEQMAARAQRRAQLPSNVGLAWTSEEEQALLSEFQRGETAAAIAALHGRTLRAIETRLERMGLITPQQYLTAVQRNNPAPSAQQRPPLLQNRREAESRVGADIGTLTGTPGADALDIGVEEPEVLCDASGSGSPRDR